MFDPKEIVKTQRRMESARMPFEQDWADIGALMLPEMAHVNGQFSTPGEQRNDAIFDEYAELTIEDGVSVFEAFVLPKGQKWQLLRLGDDKLMERQDVQAWLEMVEERLYLLRDDPESGFANAVNHSIKSLFGFGLQSMYVDTRRNEMGRLVGLSYESEHFAEIYFIVRKGGMPLRIHRKMIFTAEQALAEWGDEAPTKVKEAMSGHNKRPDEEFEIIHVIMPNERMQPDRIDAVGKPWIGGYYCVKSQEVFKTGGYWSLPRIVSRWSRASNEGYGRSRAQTILPSVKAAQVVMQDRIITAESNAKPQLLGRDDELDESVLDLGPYGFTPGGLDEMGRPTIQRLFEQLDATDLKELHAETRALIDKAWFRELLQIARETKTHIPAARILEEIAEKGILAGPFSLQENEWLSRMLARELALMDEIGWLDPMPQAVAEYLSSGAGMGIFYDNPLNRMRQAAEAAGLLRTAEQVVVFAQFDPQVVPLFRREFPMSKWLPRLARINGVPASWMATDEEKAAYDAEEAAKADTQQLLDALPGIAQVQKSLNDTAGADVV